MEENDLKYAGFWIRVGATIIDTLLLLALTIPLALVFIGPSYWSDDFLFHGPLGVLIDWILPICLTLAFWVYYQATPGKMAIAAKIVDARSGKAPRFGQWVIRYIGYFVAIIPFGAGILWVAFDSRKQGWHDKMAGTVVVCPKRSGAEQVVFRTSY